MPEGKLLEKASLEERIKCILRTPELEIDGNAFKGKYELNNVKSIKGFILSNLRKSYTNQSTGDEIILSHNSAGKLARRYVSGEAYQKTIVHIPQIIEKMQFLGEMLADKKDAKFDKYSYYITPVKIDGENYTILSTIEHNRQEIYYDQNLFKEKPEKVFEEAKISTNRKYERLNKILKDENIEKRQLEADPG
jgi:hypothetical protein